MATIKGYDFTLVGDPVRVRATVHEALEVRKYRLTWQDEWTATAEPGSKVANAVAGAIAQYFKVGVAIRSSTDGNSIMRVERQSSGWMGGSIGVSRTTKNLVTLREGLDAAFSAAGVLIATTPF